MNGDQAGTIVIVVIEWTAPPVQRFGDEAGGLSLWEPGPTETIQFNMHRSTVTNRTFVAQRHFISVPAPSSIKITTPNTTHTTTSWKSEMRQAWPYPSIFPSESLSINE